MPRDTKIDPKNGEMSKLKSAAPVEQADMPIKILGLHRSEEVWTRAIDVMGSADLAMQWLSKPAIALNRQKPIEMMITPEGAEQILDLLFGLDYGVYT